MNPRYAHAIFLLVLAGCGSVTVKPIDDGVYTMQRPASVLEPDALLKFDLERMKDDANTLCAQEKKRAEILIDSFQKDIPFWRAGSVYLKFRCVAGSLPS